jgi:DNA invertase Pin-like site-specific DNA recombinase
LFVGPVEDALVLHRCDNPDCVNPDHLYLGDYSANQQDRNIRHRNPASKLTEEIISEARAEREKGATYTELAERFGVVPSTIYHALAGKTWRHANDQRQVL